MTQIQIFLPILAATAALAGCMPVPRSAPAPVPMAAPMAPMPVDPIPATTASAFNEREPDLCGAKTYVSALSQPGTVIPTLGITNEYRVVEYRGIEPQEYNPKRIVFRLDAAGTITNVDCG